MRFIQTLLAFLGGAAAAALWLDRQTPPERSQPDQPDDSAPRAARVVEQDPDQAAQIERIEGELAELADQRSRREPPPDEPTPEIDAIRAARARAYELERQLARQLAGQDHASTPRWSEIEPPAPEALIDAAAMHLPGVAIRAAPKSDDPDIRASIWAALGALHEFAQACADNSAVSAASAWFEFHGDFARWCAESGHPDALPAERLGVDASRPIFPVDVRVNRSGEMAAPHYITVGDGGGRRLYYIDDAAGATGRMHVVGYA